MDVIIRYSLEVPVKQKSEEEINPAKWDNDGFQLYPVRGSEHVDDEVWSLRKVSLMNY